MPDNPENPEPLEGRSQAHFDRVDRLRRRALEERDAKAYAKYALQLGLEREDLEDRDLFDRGQIELNGEAPSRQYRPFHPPRRTGLAQEYGSGSAQTDRRDSNYPRYPAQQQPGFGAPNKAADEDADRRDYFPHEGGRPSLKGTPSARFIRSLFSSDEQSVTEIIHLHHGLVEIPFPFVLAQYLNTLEALTVARFSYAARERDSQGNGFRARIGATRSAVELFGLVLGLEGARDWMGGYDDAFGQDPKRPLAPYKPGTLLERISFCKMPDFEKYRETLEKPVRQYYFGHAAKRLQSQDLLNPHDPGVVVMKQGIEPLALESKLEFYATECEGLCKTFWNMIPSEMRRFMTK
jgi:hypothetical protein